MQLNLLVIKLHSWFYVYNFRMLNFNLFQCKTVESVDCRRMRRLQILLEGNQFIGHLKLNSIISLKNIIKIQLSILIINRIIYKMEFVGNVIFYCTKIRANIFISSLCWSMFQRKYRDETFVGPIEVCKMHLHIISLKQYRPSCGWFSRKIQNRWNLY